MSPETTGDLLQDCTEIIIKPSVWFMDNDRPTKTCGRGISSLPRNSWAKYKGAKWVQFSTIKGSSYFFLSSPMTLCLETRERDRP